MFNIGPLELMVILVVALLVVGPTRLPEVGRSIGRGLREFRKAQDEVQRTLRLSLDEDEPPSRPMRATTPPAETGDASVAAQAGEGDGEPADATGGAGEPGGGAEDIAKALGRGLAELRRAKEEIQNSFRIDLNDGGNRSRGK